MTIDYPTTQHFLDQHENTIIGLMHQFEEHLKDLYHINAPTKTVLNNNKLSIKTALAEIQQIDLLLVNNLDDATLHSERNNQLAIVADKTAANALIYQQMQENRESMADNLLADLMAIPANEDFEINEKTIYHIYVHAFVKGNNLTTTQLNTVENLAYTCSKIGGPAVHLARSIYSWRTKIPVDYLTCEAEMGENNLIQNGGITDNYEFSIFPNPTAQNITIKIPDAFTESTLDIYLVDITGKVVKVQKAMLGATQINLDIDEQPNGIYFLKAFNQAQEVYTTKIIINK